MSAQTSHVEDGVGSPPIFSKLDLTRLVAEHQMLRRIGVGAYGEVWLARSVTGAFRAVKVVLRERFDHERSYEREFAGLKKFEPISRAHDALVDILQVGRNDAEGYFYCVMELADNAEANEKVYAPMTLADYMKRHGRLTPLDCARIGAVIAEGLSFLHRHGLVHRDVKPSNIIFVQGRPKLADIGLVTNVDAARSFVGTDGFIAPEGPGTPSADIYGLGKTLYEMATGRNRLDFPDLPADLEANGENGRFIELNEIILRACAPTPSERHASVEELRGELLLLEAGRSIQRLRRNERLVTIWRRAGAAALIALILSAVVIGFERRRADTAKREAAMQLKQRQLVEEKERHALENLYAADMNLTQQAIENGNYGRALALLSAYLPSAAGEDFRGLEWFYYWHILRGDSIDVLTGHTHLVSSLVLSGDGSRLFSASFDNTIREWSLESRRELRQWTMPGCAFAAISVDTAGRWIAGEGGNLHFGTLLDTDTGRWITNVSSRSSSVAFTPDGSAIARGVNSSIFATNGMIEILDLAYKAQKRIPDAGGRIFFSPNNKIAATGPWADSIKLWLWPGLAPMGTLEGAGVMMSASFSPDSSRLATVSQQGRLCVWDVASQRLLAWKVAHGGSVIWSVAFSADGKRLATAGTDQTVRTWNAETLEETHLYRGHGSEVWAAIWSKDGRQIISCGKDATIRLWDAQPASSSLRIPYVTERPVFSPDGSMVATSLRDDSVIVWECRSQRELLRLSNIDEVGGFTSEDQNLIVLTMGGEIQARSIDNGRVVESRQVNGLPTNPFKCLLSRSGRWLVYGGAEGETLLYDTVNNSMNRLVGHNETILGMAISPDERFLLTGSVDRTARLWELPSGKLVREFGNHRMGVGSVDFSMDGKSILTGSWDDTVHVWDLNAASEKMILAGHEGGVQTATFSFDNRTIVSLSGTGVLKFWSGAAQREAGQTRLSPGANQGWLSISENGEWVAAVDQSQQMTLFNAPREAAAGH
jgi:WD40 repeat protein